MEGYFCKAEGRQTTILSYRSAGDLVGTAPAADANDVIREKSTFFRTRHNAGTRPGATRIDR
jgi:hypothetical protein